MRENSGIGTRTMRHWPMRLAVGFVLITLVALVMVPWLVQERVDVLRSRIQASEPARTLVMQWQFDLVREMAALGELLLTGDSAQTAAYAAALAEEHEAHTKLVALAGQMGSEVSRGVDEARRLANHWHASINEDSLHSQRAAGTDPQDLRREQMLFAEVLAAVASVDTMIVGATASTRADIVNAERTGLMLTQVLGVLALLAAVAVLALQSRVSRFATEAEQRRVEAAEALAQSASTTEARNRLLRGISHDVKNPLGTAKGYAELIELGIKAPLHPEQAPLVAGIQRSVDSALAIIADLLDLARVDSGAVTLKRAEVDLNDVIRTAVEDHRATADTTGHELRIEPAPDGAPAHTDPVRVRQILDNLISNALKYTPAPGHIAVQAAAHGHDARKPGAWAIIEVSDNGPGIPVDQRDAVFEEFTRLDDRGVQGHGLGLAIARGLARQLGGDLTIEDSAEGATFVLWIPQRDSTGEHADRRSAEHNAAAARRQHH